MALDGPIILVEDDQNDAEVISAAIKEIGIPNTIKVIDGADEAFEYLSVTTDKPYIILCDIRMPGTDGLAFRKTIQDNEYLRKESIPFVFFTGVVSQEIVNIAYDMDIQGFYRKASSFEGIKDQLLSIFVYWKQCLHPNRAIA